MTGYELALHVDAEPQANWYLKVGRDLSGRLYTDRDPWFEIRLFREDKLVSGGVAQPLTCFQAVAKGRKTAMLCPAGILALTVKGEAFTVDLHGSDGRVVRGSTSIEDFLRLAEQLAQVPA